MLEYLESGVGVVQELLEVGLEPLTSLWGGLERIGQTTVAVVADGSGVGSTIRLTTGYIICQ